MGSTVILALENLNKSYGANRVVKDLNLAVGVGDFVSILGPSGCGKTTTLRLIGGFEQADSGSIIFRDKRMDDLPPYKRPLNTVFQNYALFPHLSVGENIAFAMECSGKDRNHIRRMTGEILELVNLQGTENRRINSLSGGQQQRVAIARALVNRPSLLLLDEPLGALDLKLRQNMQKELKRIQEQVGITFLYVTHDQEEALALSDKIAVMNGGELQQWGSPEDIYNEPRNRFVARFVGLSNILVGSMPQDRSVNIAGKTFDCVDPRPGDADAVEIVIRPEDIDLLPRSREGETNTLPGVVRSALFKGVNWEMTIEGGENRWLVHSTDRADPGEPVVMRIDPDAIHVMPGERA